MWHAPNDERDDPKSYYLVIPAQAGIRLLHVGPRKGSWTPAFARAILVESSRSSLRASLGTTQTGR